MNLRVFTSIYCLFEASWRTAGALISPHSGTTIRQFNQADQLIAMQDANGGAASYSYDAAGRIKEQTLSEGKPEKQSGKLAPGGPATSAAPTSVTTKWHYAGRKLVRLEHPSQSETYAYDARGLKISRTVIVPKTGSSPDTANTSQALTATTAYEHNEAGQLTATRLPDGSRIQYERNGQGQLVSLSRNPIQTPWLRWTVADQSLAKDFQRDLAGLSRYTSGNGVTSQWQRSAAGDLARIVHRAPASGQTVTAGKPDQMLFGYSTQDTIQRLLGITAAHAQTTEPNKSEPEKRIQPGEAGKAALPGALSQPTDPQALIDHRYLWDDTGNLLLSQSPSGTTTEQAAHAYTRRGQLVASVRSTTPAQKQDPAMQQVGNNVVTATEQQSWRYAYDNAQRRIASQESTGQSELVAGTQNQQFQANTARAQGTDYDAAGMPLTVQQISKTQRHLRWDAAGRLMSIGQTDPNGKRLQTASYQYDHRGLRNTKTVYGAPPATSTSTSSSSTTHYFYSEDQQLLAEVNASGKLTRQYIYLADMPIVMIDTPQGKPLSNQELPAHILFGLDLQIIVKNAWHALTNGMIRSDKAEATHWLHVNHLGAPEVVTDSDAQPIWQASYAPFGSIIQASLKTKAAFEFNLRSPGQYEDAESGLYYNRQRYYDPSQGSYISPDPLGTPDGPNPYAYTAFNPLKYVDPDGLILFAFDGTGNDEVNVDAATNVVRFTGRYNDDGRRYVTGVGTDHSGRDTYGDIISSTYDSGVILDKGGNYSGPDRIKRMRLYFDDEAETAVDTDIMQVDIVGFSRGASQARDFANKVTAATSNGYYKYQTHKRDGSLSVDAQGKAIMRCQKVNFRFMGLWDTVLATNRSGYAYQLGIPADFKYVAQAVALNEYRSAPAGNDAFATANTNFRLWDQTRVNLPNKDHYGGFQLESIGASSNQVGRTRIERGFLGAHADIGGGYATNNTLSAVALSWMVGQAQTAGVAMNVSNISVGTNNPVIHDQSNALRVGDPRTVQQFRVSGTLFGTNQYPVEDRVVSGGLGGGTQRTQTFGAPEAGGNRSLTNADIDTERFITYTPRNFQANDTRRTTDIAEVRNLNNETGTVNMQAYMSWLRGHGYAFAGLNQ